MNNYKSIDMLLSNYVEMGYNPSPVIGFMELSTSEIFDEQYALPLLLVIAQNIFNEETGGFIFGKSTIKINSHGVFNIIVDEDPSSLNLPAWIIKESLKILGNLIDEGSDNLSYVGLISDKLNEIYNNGKNPLFINKELIPYIKKLTYSKMFFNHSSH